MTAAQHTPGPWTLQPLGRVVAPEGFAVAEIYDADPRNDNPEQTANARLIAAAPDLLEAAKFYVANCPQRGRNDHDRDCDGPMCRMFRAAIAKAEGTTTE